MVDGRRKAEAWLNKYGNGYNTAWFVHEAAEVIQNLLLVLQERYIAERELHDQLAKMHKLYQEKGTKLER